MSKITPQEDLRVLYDFALEHCDTIGLNPSDTIACNKERLDKVLNEIKHPRLNQLVIEAHQNAIDKGWWENPKSFGEIIALIHSEASEALEQYRDGRKPTETYYSGKVVNDDIITIHAETKNKTAMFFAPSKYVSHHIFIDKPEGIPSELADVVIRVMDICGYYGIDLEAAIKEKMDYNKTRPLMHGGKAI